MTATDPTITVPTIAVAWLEQHRACANQVARFREIFGERAELTRANLMRAADAGLDLEWFGMKILSDPEVEAIQQVLAPAREAYKQATAPLLKAYEQAMAPPRAAFQRDLASAIAEILGLPDGPNAEEQP